MNTQSRHPPILSVVGFAVAGMFSFGLLCAAMVVVPDALTGNAPRGPALALAHLTTLGWISSLLFAGTYLVSPVLSGGPLWSRRLPSFHFCCHLLGLGLLIGGSVVLSYNVASIGAGILVAGFLALLLNVYQTGSARSVWTPSNLAFHSAIFWLTITGGMALVMLYGRLGGELPVEANALIALHAHYGLFGFLTQVLLAVSLRVVPEMLTDGARSTSPDRLGWIGWSLLNGGLLLLFPASQPGWRWPLFGVGVIIALGVLGFVLRITSVLWQHRRRISWAELTHATGILLLVVIVVGALATYPRAAAGSAEQLRDWMRLYISLALLGPFAFAILGVGQKFVPKLVWMLRLAPWAQHGRFSGVGSLARPAAGGGVYFSLLLAWGYLAFGQWTGDVEAIRLGALLMLMATGWFIVAVRPAVHRFVVGVTPFDLTRSSRPAVAVDVSHGISEPSQTSQSSRRSSDLQPLSLG